MTIELRWIVRSVPSVTGQLQYREQTRHNYGPVWTEWHDVPIVVVVESADSRCDAEQRGDWPYI